MPVSIENRKKKKRSWTYQNLVMVTIKFVVSNGLLI